MIKKLLNIVIILALAVPAYAQDTLTDQIHVWESFEKGLNTKLSPFSLLGNQCTVAENVRFNEELKALSKRDKLITYGTADATEQINGLHRLYLSDGTKVLIAVHGDEIETGADATGTFTAILALSSGDYKWQWATWHDIGIGTDGQNQPVKYDGSSASATYLGSCLATDAGSGAGPDGVYTYKVTYYTASYEVEYAVASNTITVSDNDIDLSMIPIAPSTYGGEDTVGRKIYRTGAGDSTYVLLSNGDIANNTAVTLTDSDADGARSGAYPTADATHTPPKCKFILIHKDRVFLANDPTNGPSRIYYSESGNHDTFINATNFFEIRKNDGDEVTFIKNLLGMLCAGKNNTIQYLRTTGATPSSDWEISAPFSFTGCHAPYTAVNSPIGIIYLSNDGLYRFNGQKSELISEVVTPIIKDISLSNYINCWGIFYKNLFHLAYTSSETGVEENNRVLVFDLLSDAYSVDKLSIGAFCAFDSGTDDKILCAGSSATGAVYSYAESSYEVVHKTHTDFGGTWDDARYIPTGLAGGDADSPVLELGWTETLDDIATHINNVTGDINRPDTNGTYTSSAIEINAAKLDKLYWNEVMPSGGGDVTFSIKVGSNSTNVDSDTWNANYTTPSGSDISAIAGTPNFLKYKIDLTTNNIDYTPNVIRGSGYVVKLTYAKTAFTAETTVPLRWESGFTNLGYPYRIKTLKFIKCFYEADEGSTGTLSLKFENLLGDSDTFDIDLSTNPTFYKEQITDGALGGNMFKLTMTEDSAFGLTIRKVILGYDVNPISYDFFD